MEEQQFRLGDVGERRENAGRFRANSAGERKGSGRLKETRFI